MSPSTARPSPSPSCCRLTGRPVRSGAATAGTCRPNGRRPRVGPATPPLVQVDGEHPGRVAFSASAGGWVGGWGWVKSAWVAVANALDAGLTSCLSPTGQGLAAEVAQPDDHGRRTPGARAGRGAVQDERGRQQGSNASMVAPSGALAPCRSTSKCPCPPGATSVLPAIRADSEPLTQSLPAIGLMQPRTCEVPRSTGVVIPAGRDRLPVFVTLIRTTVPASSRTTTVRPSTNSGPRSPPTIVTGSLVLSTGPAVTAANSSRQPAPAS